MDNSEDITTQLHEENIENIEKIEKNEENIKNTATEQVNEAQQMRIIALKAIEQKTTYCSKAAQRAAQEVINELDRRIPNFAKKGEFGIQSSIDLTDEKWQQEFNSFHYDLVDLIEKSAKELITSYFTQKGYIVDASSNYVQIFWDVDPQEYII